ncbi:MAG: pilus assembly protein [bacterium]|nr:pilus assembly protein [bacterium]
MRLTIIKEADITSRDERGTASLEAMLCLPFVFLVFALILNMGYGWVMRMKADAAARFAGTYCVHVRSEAADPGTACYNTGMEEIVRQKYFPHIKRIFLHIPEVPPDVGGVRDAGGQPIENSELGGLLAALWQVLSGRTVAELYVPLHAPTGTLLPSKSLKATFAVDGNTWTYREVPLSLGDLTELPAKAPLPPVLEFLVQGIVNAVKDFYWLLGMEP